MILAVIMVLALAACGESKPGDSAQPSNTPDASASPSASTEPQEPGDSSALAAEWTREGYFADEDGNMLSITWMDDDEPGWYVGCMLGEDLIDDSYGGILKQEGTALKGTLTGEKGDLTVSVSEDGEEGMTLAVEGGETYHFTPLDLPDATIIVNINVEGRGNIDYAPGETAPEIGDPYQSAQINLAESETYTFVAWPYEGWKFVKWTKDGADFSTDEQITLELAETAEYIAVFEEDENWVDPLAVLAGNYESGRARAEVEMIGESAFVTIEWSDSAWTVFRWNIAGFVDRDTLTLEYVGCTQQKVTYNSDEEIESETEEYDDGPGTLVFTQEGPGFTWHDDMSDREDMVFEWIPAAE